MSGKQWRILGIVLFLGCLLRLILCLIARYEVTPYDDLDYLGRGLYFSRGGSPGCWRSPMEWWFIGITMRLFNYHLLPVRLSHTLASCALLPLVFLLSRRFAGFSASLVILIITAFWFEFPPYCIYLMSEGLGTFFLVGAVWISLIALDALKKESPKAWLFLLGTGMAWGLTALTRETYFYTTLAMFLPLGMALKKFKKIVLSYSLVLAGLFLIILPYTARNVIMRKTPVLISYNGAFNLWKQWNTAIPYEELNRQFFAWPENQRERLAYKKAWECLKANPAYILKEGIKSFFRMWTIDEMTSRLFYFGIITNGNRTIPIILALLVPLFLLILMAGFFVHLRNTWNRPDFWVIYLVIFSSLFMHAAVYGQGRYRVPWTPFIIICGILGWQYILEDYRSRKKHFVFGVVSSLLLFSLAGLVIGKDQVRAHEINIRESAEKMNEKRYLKAMHYHFGTAALIFRQRQDKITPLLPQEKK